MRSSLCFSAFLIALCWGWACSAAQAQEQATLFDEVYPSPVEPDLADRIFAAPDPAEHTGLLGKVYLQQRYTQQNIDDPDFRLIDKTIQGFNSALNLPVATLDLPVPLDVDAFFGYSNATLKGSHSTGAPLDLTISMNGKIENFAVGMTIYPTLAERWRPFVQVGADFARADVDMTMSDPNDTFADNFVDHDTSLLLNAGFEYDLFDSLGYRVTFDFETEDRFKDSMMYNDLILWPHERVFLRGGLVTSLDGNGFGFSAGGGLAF